MAADWIDTVSRDCEETPDMRADPSVSAGLSRKTVGCIELNRIGNPSENRSTSVTARRIGVVGFLERLYEGDSSAAAALDRQATRQTLVEQHIASTTTCALVRDSARVYDAFDPRVSDTRSGRGGAPPNLRPTSPITISRMQIRRTGVAGSRKSTIPR